MSSEFFLKFPIVRIDFSNRQKFFDQNGLSILFLWGKNCPNCEIAKTCLIENLEEVKNWPISWGHADVYENFEWAHEFGVQGIPFFILFKNKKKLGRISPFPGWSQFKEAIEKKRFEIV